MSDTSLVFNLVARDRTGTVMKKVADKFKALNSFTSKMAVSAGLQPAMAAIIVAAGGVSSAILGAASATGVFGLAVAAQKSSMEGVAARLTAYRAAVKEFGVGSKEAGEAQAAYVKQWSAVPRATANAGKAYSDLIAVYNEWSDATAKDTMPVITKGLRIAAKILPHLTPLVRGAAKVFNKLLDALGRKIDSAGFASFMKKFNAWALSGLKKVVDWIGDLALAARDFVTSDGFRKFMQYGKDNGPATAKLFKDLAQFVGDFVKSAKPVAGLSFKVLTIMASALNAIPLPVLKILVPFFLLLGPALKAYAAAQAIATIAMWAWNAAMSPWLLLLGGAALTIGLIIAAVAALGVGIYFLVKHWDTVWGGIKATLSAVWGWMKSVFNNVKNWFTVTLPAAARAVWRAITGAWNSIKSGLSTAWNWIKSNVLNPIKNFFTSTIPNAARNVKNAVVNAWNTIKDRVKSAAGAVITGVKNKFNDVVAYMKKFPGRIKSAMGNLGGLLLNAGKSVVRGFVNGIKAAFGWVKDTLGNLTSKLTSWKGPPSTDKKILKPAGEMVIDGFIKGMEGKYGEVAYSLKTLTAMIPKTVSKSFAEGAAILDMKKGGLTGAKGEALARILQGKSIFEDMSFKGMSGNLKKNNDAVADSFWSAVKEMKKAMKAGKKIYEDYSFKGMSSNMGYWNEAFMQVWGGKEGAKHFGDFGYQGAGAAPVSAKSVGYTAPQAQSQQVTIKFDKSGDKALDTLFDLMRDKVRVEYGGNVQQALGKG